MTKAIIFDMDGVLVDTESWFQTQFRDMLKACGTEVSQEELRVLTGCSMEQEDAFIQEKLGVDAYTAARTKDTWLQTHPVNYAAQARPGLKETLECLKEAGFKVAIASSSPMRFIRQMIQECGLEGLFDAVVSGHDLPRTKPDPPFTVSPCSGWESRLRMPLRWKTVSTACRRPKAPVCSSSVSMIPSPTCRWWKRIQWWTI